MDDFLTCGNLVTSNANRFVTEAAVYHRLNAVSFHTDQILRHRRPRRTTPIGDQTKHPLTARTRSQATRKGITLRTQIQLDGKIKANDELISYLVSCPVSFMLNSSFPIP